MGFNTARIHRPRDPKLAVAPPVKTGDLPPPGSPWVVAPHTGSLPPALPLPVPPWGTAPPTAAGGHLPRLLLWW